MATMTSTKIPTTTMPPSSSTTSPPQPGSQTTAIRYGPFNVQGAPMNPDGTHGHAHTGNRFSFFIRKPCTDCYVTGMTASLVYQDGRVAGWNTDAQLHHMVMLAQGGGKTDATCAVSLFGLLGQRFFASGDERTPVDLTAGLRLLRGPGELAHDLGAGQPQLGSPERPVHPDDLQLGPGLDARHDPARAGVDGPRPVWRLGDLGARRCQHPLVDVERQPARSHHRRRRPHP